MMDKKEKGLSPAVGVFLLIIITLSICVILVFALFKPLL
jgi:FlaG/FlaF family flagellin (archaellin)